MTTQSPPHTELGIDPAGSTTSARALAVSEADPATHDRVARLVGVARRGLASAYDARTGQFAQTVRGLTGGAGVRVEAQGTNLRYAGMAALGLSRLPLAEQRQVLAGRTAAEVVDLAAERALAASDPGAVAMTAWAVAEVCESFPTALLARLEGMLRDEAALPTVDASWLLTAAVAASAFGDTDRLVEAAAALLRRHEGGAGLYPHVLPPSRQTWWRSHVGSFADQVYPLQALARASVLTGEDWMLESAGRTARQLCRLQGREGQWWWHYDSRDGSVVEAFPVYSVHQHAMAPMVLLDLADAGGPDHRPEVAAGLAWLDHHPEVVDELVSERFGLIWRKVGRREPPKAARALGAATTALRPGARVPGLDRILPPTLIDHECRPYELGWLLYAWLSAPTQSDPTQHDPTQHDPTRGGYS